MYSGPGLVGVKNLNCYAVLYVGLYKYTRVSCIIYCYGHLSNWFVLKRGRIIDDAGYVPSHVVRRCSASSTNHMTVGMFRDVTTEPFVWSDTDITTPTDQFWTTDLRSSTYKCVDLFHMGMSARSCTTKQAYICKTSAVGKLIQF